jgi:ribosomal protein S18 acetylase RimI-like enzyme
MLQADRQRFAPASAILKDGSQVTLRLLEPTDAAALGDFYESVPREDYRHYAPHKLNRAQAKYKVEKFADSPHCICVIAVNDSEQIVGYAWCLWNDPTDERCLLGLCIGRANQGNGLGQAVLCRLLEIVKVLGPPVVCLTVNKANPRAFALYQKMGFIQLREQTRQRVEEFPAEPEYYMELRLR